MTERFTEHKHGGLGELSATAICGNDITSSCLYVSALSILYAGRWAPLSLLIVVIVLYLFRSVYSEVVGALPLNGGAYNALLNTTSKFRASLAACLTILSYMTTAVLSANEAMHYAHNLWAVFPLIPATIVLLFVFMCITIYGITESARVAVAIFLVHLVSLALLIVAGIWYLFLNGLGTLTANMQIPSENGILIALFFGFSAAMLGISGFESSANFVEEQAEGVFPKTLRNMWIAVSVLNPGMAMLALSLIPMAHVSQHEQALLAHMGSVAGGSWLSWLISIDATLVLSGAVLTSFVGVTGLVRRMTLDRCLPQFLLKENRLGTNHRIIIAFFLLTVSILLLTKGELTALAGVYTISFLAVMVLFGIGNILLKVKRTSLPRPSRAAWPAVLTGITAVIIGLAGNIIMNPAYWLVFLEYFIPAMLVIAIMLGRISILKALLYMIQIASLTIGKWTGDLSKTIITKIEDINAQQIVFFTRGDNLANLNNVMLYVRNNEHTNRIKVVNVVKEDSDVPPNLKKDLEMLDLAYPEIDIDFHVVKGVFGPELIRNLSQEWSIPANLMFIGSPGDHFMYGLADLGGVRLII
jgi:amino acid transporter